MKKVMMALLTVTALAGFTFAQTAEPYKAGTGINFTIDKLGAHQNGGRGCTGCHAPHSGGKGGGGNAITGKAFGDTESGNMALWGQDVTPLLSYTIKNGGVDYILPASESDGNVADAEISGIMFCLSCHDGNVAKGGMMTGVAFEKANGLLPPNVYGPNSIPTLLGNDGTTAGNYENDHPIGIAANMGAVGIGKYLTLDTVKLTVSYTNTTANAVSSGFDKFVQNYGIPAIQGGRGSLAVRPGAASANEAFVTCTTCHTPHTMYIAKGTFGGLTGNFPTYFFLVGPYNPGADTQGGQKASSATQFCRQCHFSGAGGANESVGIFNVTTAF